MMNRSGRWLGLITGLAVVLITGCESDPSGPCSASGACEVAGVDLAVEDVSVIWPAGQRLHEGVPVVELADSIRVRVLLRNRGDTVSVPVQLLFCVSAAQRCVDPDAPAGIGHGALQIPALEPGERFDESIGLILPLESQADAMYVTAALEPNQFEDPIHNNDLASSSGFYLDNPRVNIGLWTGPFSTELRVGDPTLVTVGVVNVARIGTYAGGVVALCVWTSATGECTELGTTTIPDLEAGDATEQTILMTVPQHVPQTVTQPLTTDIRTCVRGSHGEDRMCTYPRLTFLPDLSGLCGTEPMDIAGEYELQGTPAGCDLAGRNGLVGWTFTGLQGNAYVFSFLVHTGTTPELLIFDDRGALIANVSGTFPSLRFEPVLPGIHDYHVLVRGAGDFRLQHRVFSAG